MGPNYPFAWKDDFLRRLINTTFVYLLCSIMLLCLKKKPLRVGQIMRYKILLFGFKLDTNDLFALAGDFFEKLTDVNFVYFMYPITILQCLNYSGSRNTRLHNFWTNWPEAFLGGKLTIVTFANLLCPS